MANCASPRFWAAYRALPADIRDIADKRFELFQQNPRHPSLHLKKVGAKWSVRVGRGYRALAVETDDCLLWTWIGSHDDYVREIAKP